MKKLLALALGAAGIVGASGAEAAVVTYSNRAAFEAGIGGSNGGENFNAFVVDTSFQNTTVAASNMMITGEPGTNGANSNKIDVAPLGFAAAFSFDGTAELIGDLAGSQQIRIDFTTAITAWGADTVGLGSTTRDTQIRFYSLANVLLGTLQGAALAADTKEFYGISLDGPAAYAIIGFNTVSNDVFAVDNVVFKTAPSVVPLPAALPLFAAGLAGLGFAGASRRKALAGRQL